MNRRYAYYTALVLLSLGLAAFYTYSSRISSEERLAKCKIIWTSLNVSTASQADSHLITIDDELSILLDAGRDSDAKDIIIPFLKESGVDEIDYAIITHAHDDHFGGFEYVSAQIPIDNLITHFPTKESCDKEDPSWGCDLPKFQGTVDSITRKQDMKPQSGFVIGKEQCGLKLIHQYSGSGDLGTTDVNNATGVYRLNANGNTALFTADIGKVTGDFLVQEMRDQIDVDVYKFPHHGATHHAGKNLLEASSPLSIVVPGPVWLSEHERGAEAFENMHSTPKPSFWNGLDGNVVYTFTDSHIYVCNDIKKHEFCTDELIK